MSESSADEMLGTPPDIAEAASIVKNDLLPDKSRKRYERERSLFRIWCKKKNVTTLTENVMLAYFLEKSEVMKSSTLWSIYSMLKASLILSDNVDISKFGNLVAFLKKKSVGYKAKKSSVLTRENISQFLLEAPDSQYLIIKVALIMGVAGACRRDELSRMEQLYFLYCKFLC